MSLTCTCGCCEGIMIAVPQNTANRPGLPALAYRIGTHATFLETMIARLSSHDFPALAALKSRDPADPSIALLDSWALVADVLSFYQERVANEGYLRTALERRSVLELARLIGYKFRPGVAATVFLAYTLEEDRSKTPPLPTRTTIAAGSRSQSVPEADQLPQSFETAGDLDARSSWNNLQPRLTQPQIFTLGKDPTSDADQRSTIYLQGISTNLKAGDPLLLILSDKINPAQPEQILRLVQSVETQSDQSRTLVTLQGSASFKAKLALTRNEGPLALVTDAVMPFVRDATELFSTTALAAHVASLLSNPAPLTPPGLLEKLAASADKSGAFAARMIQRILPELTKQHELAVSRKFTRLEPWLTQLVDVLGKLVPQLQALDAVGREGAVAERSFAAKGDTPPLSALTALLPSLGQPPSLQPRNSLTLARSVPQAFASLSDMAPRLLSAFAPAAAPLLYRAWSRLQVTSTTTQVGAMRIKTGLFPGSYPGTPTTSGAPASITTVFSHFPTIKNDWQVILDDSTEKLGVATLALDSVYDKIQAGSWLMVDRPNFELGQNPTAVSVIMTRIRSRTFHRVTGTKESSMISADGAFSTKVTLLSIDPPWLGELEAKSLALYLGAGRGLLSGTVVYAQTEILDLAEEPITDDIAGDTIELASVYDGLESGRWIIVSGERTDIPNVTGITASELVMVQGVVQATFSKNSRPGPIHTVLTLANQLAYTYDPKSTVIYGNVVKATHGESRKETLGSGDGSQTFQQFALKQKPVTFISASNPTGVDSTLEVYVNNIEWHEAATLAGLGAKDRKFVVKTADDDTMAVTFGNGQQGARLPTGTGNVMATYRNGIGQPGNVNAGQISLLQTRPLNVKAVINPLRASGGADRDSRDQARRNAPLAVLALDRLVAVRDYADFARTFAGVGKATAARLSDGQRGLVYVTIAGADDIPIDRTSDLYANLGLALRTSGDPYLPVEVAVRSLRLLVISANVKILPDYLWEPVAAAIRRALTTTFGFDQRDLGQPVFQSEVIAAIQAVEGVAYVDLQILDAVAEGITAAQLATLGTDLKLNDFIAARPAGLNPTPLNYPDDAIRPAELLYLTSSIPDTLILNEVKS